MIIQFEFEYLIVVLGLLLTYSELILAELPETREIREIYFS